MFIQQWVKWKKPPNINKLSSNSNQKTSKKANRKITKIELNQRPISKFQMGFEQIKIAELTRRKIEIGRF